MRSFIILAIVVAILAAAAVWIHHPQAARSLLPALHGGR
jgi:hypothetical protein